MPASMIEQTPDSPGPQPHETPFNPPNGQPVYSVFCVVVSTLAAQPVAPAPNPPRDKDEVVTLTPFEVSAAANRAM